MQQDRRQDNAVATVVVTEVSLGLEAKLVMNPFASKQWEITFQLYTCLYKSYPADDLPSAPHPKIGLYHLPHTILVGVILV